MFKITLGSINFCKNVIMTNASSFTQSVQIVYDVPPILGENTATILTCCKLLAGTSFQFFPGAGKILADFLGGGNMKKNKILCAKTQKKLFFKISGHMPPSALLPTNDVPACWL